MSKKTFPLIVPLLALCIIGFLSGNVYPGPSGHYGIGGTASDCNICHDFNGFYGGGSVYGDPIPPPYQTVNNIRWVRSPIVYPSVISPNVQFFTFSGAANSGVLADDTAPRNGPCEVCHTTTSYYRNIAGGSSHYGGNCMPCHPHFLSDITNYFEPRFVGNQSHFTHFDDPKGPMIGTSTCLYNLGGCHNSSAYSKFGPENASLSLTTVCNACHSQNGAFNGVGNLGTCSVTTSRVCNEDSDCPGETCNIDANSVAFGAKANWERGVYESVPSGFPNKLKGGKENWCAGCHDAGTSAINSISAPNVMGNNSTYGYNVNGHGHEGIFCADCHDFAVVHTDGSARTYSASAIPNNYKSGYRLNADLAVPRNGEIFPAAFRLCTNCHNYAEIIGSPSNFRDDLKAKNYHQMHLEWWPALVYCDSDFSGTGCSSGTCKDSAITCIICHNVHGANGNTVMIRHGELISTPGTTDKVPALDFHWYKADGVTQTTVFEESRYGGLRCGILPDISINHVCGGCHAAYPPDYEIKYYRLAGGPTGVTVESVWTSDLNDLPKVTFKRDEGIRYHVRFRSNGPAPTYFMKSPGTASMATITTTGGPVTQKLIKGATLAPGTYEWTGDTSWDFTIPSNATLGSTATVTVKIKMLSAPGGTLIGSSKNSYSFNISATP